MRPVVIPRTPTSYKEEELRRKILRVVKVDNSIEEMTTESASAKMLDLLDEWLAGGAKYAQLDKTKFPNKKQKRNTAIAEKSARERLENMMSTTRDSIAGTRKRGRSYYTIEDIGSETKSWTLALLRDAFKPEYGAARRDLITAIGQYCSYCETPIYSHLAIEHRLPKQFYPKEAYNWHNFLLSCVPCNSIKSNKPDLTKLDVPDPVKPDRTAFESSYLAVISNDRPSEIAWPSGYAANFSDGAPFPIHARFEIASKTETGRGARKYPRYRTATKTEIAAIIENYRIGLVRLWDGVVHSGNTLRTYDGDKVRVILDPPSKETDAKNAAASAVPAVAGSQTLPPIVKKPFVRMIEFVDLNRQQGNNGDAAVDRRMELRTLTMLRAYDLCRIRGDAISNMLGESCIEAIDAMICDTAQASGFWSMWMIVFSENSTLCERITRCFPGTATVRWRF